MSPKGAKAAPKKGKGKGKAKQEPAPVLDGDPPALAAGGEGDALASHPANVDYLAKLQEAWSTVCNHPVFAGVQNRAPYEIEAGTIADQKIVVFLSELCFSLLHGCSYLGLVVRCLNFYFFGVPSNEKTIAPKTDA